MGINVRIQSFPAVKKAVKAEKKDRQKSEIICRGCPYQQTERYCFPCIPLSDLCTDYQNYADLLEHSGKYEESREYYQKCINLIKKGFSEDSPKLAQSYLGIANCCMGMEAYELAISHLIKLNALADDDPLLQRVMNHKLGTCSALLKKMMWQ